MARCGQYSTLKRSAHAVLFILLLLIQYTVPGIIHADAVPFFLPDWHCCMLFAGWVLHLGSAFSYIYIYNGSAFSFPSSMYQVWSTDRRVSRKIIHPFGRIWYFQAAPFSRRWGGVQTAYVEQCVRLWNHQLIDERDLPKAIHLLISLGSRNSAGKFFREV